MSNLKADFYTLFQKEEHLDLIKELAIDLGQSSEAVLNFRDSFKNLPENRRAILKSLVRSSLIIDLLKMKFSFMPNEWNIAEEKGIRAMMESKSQVTENWGEMEF